MRIEGHHMLLVSESDYSLLSQVMERILSQRAEWPDDFLPG